jgi:hypothetical protein
MLSLTRGTALFTDSFFAKPIGGSWGKGMDKESDRNKAVKREVKYANE